MCCVRWSNEAVTVHADITADNRDVPANLFTSLSEWEEAQPKKLHVAGFWFFTSIFLDGLPVGFSQSVFWSQLSFRFQHENEHRSFYMVLRELLLSCHWLVLGLLNFAHGFMVGILIFPPFIEEIHRLRQRGCLYIYIQAWLSL